jgi:hypothetical protein
MEKRKKKSYRERMIESYVSDPRCVHTVSTNVACVWYAEYGRVHYYDEKQEYKNQKKLGIRRNEKRGRSKEERGNRIRKRNCPYGVHRRKIWSLKNG